MLLVSSTRWVAHGWCCKPSLSCLFFFPFYFCRWVKAGTVVGHPGLRGLRHIRIDNPPTVSRFWRWHIEGEGHICTAEGVHVATMPRCDD